MDFFFQLANFHFHVATKYFWLVALGVAFDLSLQAGKNIDGHMSVKRKTKMELFLSTGWRWRLCLWRTRTSLLL